jgi:hypothetical protein
MSLVEILGYVAAGTVALSMMLRDPARLRALNGVGALLFVGYGFLIVSRPVVILNGFIAVADFYYLRQVLLARRRAAAALPGNPVAPAQGDEVA